MQPWYPGQMGVADSDVQRGLRWEPQGIVLYVDENHPGCSAAADGTDPEHPLTTIQGAITNLTNFATAMSTSLEGSVIVVAAESTPAESVIIPATAPKNCTLLGAGDGINAPAWTAATAAGTALTIRQQGWTIEGFLFRGGALGTSINLEWVPGSSYVGYRTVIRNNHFDGLWQGLYAINLEGAPYDVIIQNNWFREWRSGSSTGYAVFCTDSSTAEPYMCQVVGNIFQENDNHVGGGGTRSFNASVIKDNVFMSGKLISATIMLDLRSNHGGNNVVAGNVFEGDYSNTGGYYDSTDSVSCWVGNYAQDVAEAEVGDNGLTIAPPAA